MEYGICRNFGYGISRRFGIWDKVFWDMEYVGIFGIWDS